MFAFCTSLSCFWIDCTKKFKYIFGGSFSWASWNKEGGPLSLHWPIYRIKSCVHSRVNGFCKDQMMKGFQLSVARAKPKYSLRPITRDANNTTSQSELERNTRDLTAGVDERVQARHDWFGFRLDYQPLFGKWAHSHPRRTGEESRNRGNGRNRA